MNLSLRTLYLILISAFCLLPSAFSQNWNSFRGPQSSGIFDGADLPDSWNGKSGENIQWKNDYGLLRSVFFVAEYAEWEWASSPIIHDEVVLIQVDVMDQSFIAALDIKTGKEIWRTDRDEIPTWCTPNVYQHNGKTRVVLNGYKRRAAYDFETGEEIWFMSGGGDIPIPTPQVVGDMIYFNSAHGLMAPIFAIRTNAQGDISLEDGQETNDYIVWSKNREGAYMATILIYNDLLYVARWNGSFACFDAETGELYYKETLARGKSFTGSPVAADGKVYFTNDEGTVFVMKSGKDYYKLAELQLGATCMVSPAIKKGQIFFRTIEGIMAVGE